MHLSKLLWATPCSNLDLVAVDTATNRGSMGGIHLSVSIKRSMNLKAEPLKVFAYIILFLVAVGTLLLCSAIGSFVRSPDKRCEALGQDMFGRLLGLGADGSRGQQEADLAGLLSLVRYAERMSVKHYTFPGQLPSNNSLFPPANVVLHLFVKCILQPSQEEALCSGWGFVETIGEIQILHRHLAQPLLIATWSPQIELRTGAPGKRTVYPFTVSKVEDRDAEIRPFHLQAVVPLLLRGQVPELHVDSWPRFHYFQNLEAPEVPAGERDLDQTWLLLSSFYYEPPGGSYALAAQLLVHHVRHHLAMGLAGEIVYVQHHYPPQLLRNPELRDYVLAGQLQIVVWDCFPKYDTPGFPTTDQPLQYSHGLLENWGRGRRILIADVDEFLVTPHPGNISSVLACTKRADQARFRRFDVMCSREKCPGNGDAEAGLWSSPKQHPLQHYTLMDRTSMSTVFGRMPKVLISPETVRHFYVHEGVVAPGGMDVDVSEECAFLVHVLCLYSKRSDRANFHRDTSWHWFLPQEERPRRMPHPRAGSGADLPEYR